MSARTSRVPTPGFSKVPAILNHSGVYFVFVRENAKENLLDLSVPGQACANLFPTFGGDANIIARCHRGNFVLDRVRFYGSAGTTLTPHLIDGNF